MNKPAVNTKSLTLAVVLALGQLMVSNTAFADNVRSWGPWDAATAAGPGSTGQDGGSLVVEKFDTSNNTTNQNLNSETNTLLSRGQVTVPSNNAPGPQYVGYTLCYYNCNGDYRYYGATTAGTINMDVKQGAERVADRTHYETGVTWWSNGKNYYTNDTQYYDGELTVVGTYNGVNFKLTDSKPSLRTSTDTYYESDTYTNTYIYSYSDTTSFSANLDSQNSYSNSSYPVKQGNIYMDNTNGTILFGKPVAAAQIAEQLRLGQTYNFSGYSQMGSYVNISVNFQNASWNGNWTASNDYNSGYNWQTGYAKLQNGFSATGNISGSTLTSTSVTGAGQAGVGYVTGGKVDGTLVGSIVGTDASAAAVIGKTVVNVQQAVGTKPVADIFNATAQGAGCGKGCS